MFNWKKTKQVAEENGIKYHTLKRWIDQGLVEASKSLGNTTYFSPIQEEKLKKQLKGDIE
jgi:predicted site-specific integrase-resolvase